MARILGGVATSHSPTIGFALDRHKQDDPVWAPIFEAYRPVQEWLAKKKPDVLFVIYNDHVTSFFFDHYSHFALGIDDHYAVADEGGGPRALPPIRGHAGLAHHIAAGLAADEFDLSVFQDHALDHGCCSPLSMLWPHDPHHQLAGVEKLEGTYPFTYATSVKAYRLNKFLHDLTDPGHRLGFLTDQEAAFEQSGLTTEERDLVRRRDWREMIHYGVIFFMLEKLGVVVGVSNLHIYAAMRGQTLEDFQKTRNAPGALYSVAGNEAGGLTWDKTRPIGT